MRMCILSNGGQLLRSVMETFLRRLDRCLDSDDSPWSAT